MRKGALLLPRCGVDVTVPQSFLSESEVSITFPHMRYVVANCR